MTPELFNLLTLPCVLDPALTLPVEDVDGNTYDVIQLINKAFDSVHEVCNGRIPKPE